MRIVLKCIWLLRSYGPRLHRQGFPARILATILGLCKKDSQIGTVRVHPGHNTNIDKIGSMPYSWHGEIGTGGYSRLCCIILHNAARGVADSFQRRRLRSLWAAQRFATAWKAGLVELYARRKVAVLQPSAKYHNRRCVPGLCVAGKIPSQIKCILEWAGIRHKG